MKFFRNVAIASAFAIASACSTAPTPKPAPVAAPVIANVAGNWNMSMVSPAGNTSGKMIVIQNGSNITGTLETPHGSVGFIGTVGASDIKFSYQIPGLQGPPFEHIGTVDGAFMTGNATFGTFGTGTFTAKRP
jgi:hypothetical protein